MSDVPDSWSWAIPERPSESNSLKEHVIARTMGTLREPIPPSKLKIGSHASRLPYCALIEVTITPETELYDEEKEITLVRELVRKQFDHLYGSLLKDEISCCGWKEFLYEDTYDALPAGRWLVFWDLHGSGPDYYGEYDYEVHVKLAPRNRRARRAVKYMTKEKFDAIPWINGVTQ